MNLIKWILPLTLLVACSNNEQLNQSKKPGDQTLLRSEAFVLDASGAPIANAEVQIGDVTVTTDSNGVFNAPNWSGEQAVTITKEGFVKITYLKQKAQNQIFEIHPRKSSVRTEVKGIITGFGALPTDGFIDFGLSMTSLDVQNALNFDISQIISEENDKVTVMGQELRIPTNVFVPKQKENYSFLPVTIEKAFYRLFYYFQGTYKVQTNRGKFDFKKVADKLKAGKSFFEVVNDFEFLSLGTKTVTVAQQNVALDMDANQRKLTPKVNFSTPLPAAGMLFGITMFEEDGRLLPVDIKLREAKSQMLLLPENVTKGSVLLVNADKVQETKEIAGLSNSMSSAIIDSQKLDQGFLLERIAAPQIVSSAIKLSKPTLKGNVKGFATYAAISNVKVDRFDNFMLERADVTWEIYSPEWIDVIDLPGLIGVNTNQKLQVVFYGIDSVETKKFNGPQTLNQATHAVQNSVTF